jgi:hypothetical protein
MNRVVWIGLASVNSPAGNRLLNGRRGGFVNVLAIAETSEAFRRQAVSALNDLGFQVDDIEDVKPFPGIEGGFDPDHELCLLAKQIVLDPQVKFGTFHSYPDDDFGM